MLVTSKKVLVSCGLAMILAAAGLYGAEELPLVNTETLSLKDIENLSISYGHDEVILRESETGDLVIREYMTRDQDRYHVRVSRTGRTVQIRRGRRPWFLRWNWRARVEIYLPRSFRENLRIVNSSGIVSGDADLLNYKSIDLTVSSGSALFNAISGETVSVHVSSGEADIRELGGGSFVSVSSGRMQIGALTGGEHRIKVSSGRLRIKDLEGDSAVEISSGGIAIEKARTAMDLHISSGNITVGEFSGRGNFEMSSGTLTMDIKELTGDPWFRVSSGNISVTLPAALPFNLDALTKSGRVTVHETGGQEPLQVSGNSTVLRPFGPSPERTIYTRTSSGNISITRK
ncbi:MAG: DUF4097 domain-containing protein [Treponema sp.]|jgi:hypothetical protein|nr:DUF4097 domain-containing protein [Treponema sp.]